MALKIKIGADTRDFQNEFRKINQTSKNTVKDLKLVAESAKINPSGIKQAKQQFIHLSESVKETRNKLAELKSQKEAVNQAFKDGKINKKDLEAYRQHVFKTEHELAKLEKQAKETKQILDKVGKQNQFSGLKEKVSQLKEGFGKLTPVVSFATNSLKVFATTGIAVASAIATIGINAGKSADEINTLAVKTGLSTKELQQLKYASQLIDVNLETVTGSLSKITKSMDNARKGSKDTSQAFRDLGIEILDGNGELKNRNDVFKETIKALGQIENETERDALAMQLFGRSAQELTPLIKGGIDKLEELGKEAEKQGLILSEIELNQLNGIDDNFQKMKESVKGIGNQIALEFSGTISGVLEGVTNLSSKLIKGFKTGDFSDFGELATNMIKGLVSTIKNSIPAIKDGIKGVVAGVVQFLKENSRDIMDSIIEVLVSIVELIAEILPEIIALIPKLVIDLIAAIWDSLPRLWDAIKEFMTRIFEKIGEKLLFIQEIFDNFNQKCSEFGSNIFQSMSEWISKIFTSISTTASETFKQVGNFFNNLFNKVKEFPNQMISIGKDIVHGIWNGISSMASWIGEKISGFFGGIVDGAKNLLGIHSPSRVFGEIGKNMALGIDVGFSREMNGVSNSISENISNVVNNSNNFHQTINYYGVSTDDSIFKIRRNTKRLLGV